MVIEDNVQPAILIVDDERPVRELIANILRESYECVTAGSAEEALEEVLKRHYALVIADINMGEMSGIEMIPRIAELSPDTIVITISGNHLIESAIDAIRNGAFDYIKKPFKFDQVCLSVDRAVKHSLLLSAKRKHEDHLEHLVEERAQKLNYLAYHVPLTGLPNRTFFENRLSRVLLMRPTNAKASVIMVSLDRFTMLRDTLGHSLGDSLLVEAANRLSKVAAIGATAARIDGAEFALLLNDKGPDELVKLAGDIFEVFRQSITVGDFEIFLTVSIGVSLSPNDGVEAQQLIRGAAAALSVARKTGGNNCQFYSTEVHNRALRRLAMEKELSDAIEQSELELYCQPQVDTASRSVVGMEALLRWNHPTWGAISPHEFVPIAEESDLIIALGEWILRAACKQGAEWVRLGHDFTVSVNLSPAQFHRKDLVGGVRDIIKETGFDPRRLILEVTESSIMNNPESAIHLLRELKSFGIRISIDDFGTGYSSLGYLKDIPADDLKVDKSFLDDVATDPDSAAMVRAIVILAHNLRLGVVAEGVETEEQRVFLEDIKCDKWQGYLFSKPVSTNEFLKILNVQERQVPGFAAPLEDVQVAMTIDQ